MTELSVSEKSRYARHIILPEVGLQGQKRLKSASVAIIGAGGLGCPASLYLAAAGIGKLGLVDFDNVDLSNLQRQVLYSIGDVGESKAETARKKLAAINPEIEIVSHRIRLSAENVIETIAGYDYVVDGTDNFATRYLINDACVLARKINVYGSIFRFDGQVSVFCHPEGPCYRCLFPVPPPPDAVPNCAEGGVLGVLAGVIGTLQATEVVKLILGEGTPLIGKILLYNALDMEFQKLSIKRKSDCPSCGEHPAITTLIDQDVYCSKPGTTGSGSADRKSDKDIGTINKGSDTMTNGSVVNGSEVQVRDVAKIIKETPTEVVLLDVRNQNEVDFCKIDFENTIHIPLGELQSRFGELDSAADIIVYCRSGGRSRMAVDFLKQSGFKKLRNMTGGILAWSEQVDSSIPQY